MHHCLPVTAQCSHRGLQLATTLQLMHRQVHGSVVPAVAAGGCSLGLIRAGGRRDGTAECRQGVIASRRRRRCGVLSRRDDQRAVLAARRRRKPSHAQMRPRQKVCQTH